MRKVGIIIFLTLISKSGMCQYNSEWLKRNLLNMVSLSILDFRISEYNHFNPFKIEEMDSLDLVPIPFRPEKTGNPKLDTIFKDAYFASIPYNERFFFVIQITNLDTTKMNLEFNVSNRSSISDKYDTTLRYYLCYNNYHLFFSFRNLNHRYFIESIENTINIFFKNRKFQTSGIYCGFPGFRFITIDKKSIKSENYNNFFKIPLKLQKKTIEYTLYIDDYDKK
ncbi:MAG: hypothetical protein HWD58_19195 [Bacteroidota bacterium]|nr:MAG: hypothetical protein HWD58_19195 [Bacteroidota bacterium]